MACQRWRRVSPYENLENLMVQVLAEGVQESGPFSARRKWLRQVGDSPRHLLYGRCNLLRYFLLQEMAGRRPGDWRAGQGALQMPEGSSENGIAHPPHQGGGTGKEENPLRTTV